MTVLFLSDSYTPYISGVVRSIALTARALASQGHRVLVVAPAYPGMAASGPDESGAHVIRVPSVPAPGVAGFRIPVPYVRGLMGRLAPFGPVSLVHAHSPFVAGRLALAAARRMGVPVVFTHHTLYHEYVHYSRLPRRPVTAWVLRRVAAFCRQVDHIVAPSPTVEALVRRSYRVATPVSVVPTGIPLERFRGLGRDEARRALGLPPAVPLVLYVGRLGREKNVGVLVEALGRILSRVTGARALVVGGGPAEGEVRRRAGSLPDAGRLLVVGPVEPERVPLFYAAADVFLTASTTETQGLVAAEAMAAGLPVVAPAAAGLKDVVRSGVTGLLAAAEPQALAEAAAGLLEDGELRRRMGEAARAGAIEYDVHETTKRLLAVYEGVLAEARAAPASGGGAEAPARFTPWPPGDGGRDVR